MTIRALRREELARLVWQHFEAKMLEEGKGDQILSWDHAYSIREPFIAAVSEIFEWYMKGLARTVLEKLGVSHLFDGHDPWGDQEKAEIPHLRMGPDIDLDTASPEYIQELRQYLVDHYGDLIVLPSRDHITPRDHITHEQLAQSLEAEHAADRSVGLLDRADPDALREIRDHGHPEAHTEGLVTARFYHGGRAILMADPGKFRVVGVDTFASEDWVYAQYDDKQTAIECGTSHATDENGQPKKMLKVYVYDDKGRIHYEGGSR